MEYIIYTEIFGETIERYYYGSYNRNKANEVAMQMNRSAGSDTHYCVCDMEQAKALEVMYLPF